jgi:uracil permease
VRLAQGAILVTGVANIAVGLVISRLGKDAIRRILPPIVTGSIAIVIGVSLSSTALTMASGLCCLKDSRGIPAANDAWWLVALVSLTATIIYSVFLRGRGLLGLLPVLLGALTGYVVSIPFGLVDFSGLEAASWINPPRFTAPDFSWQTILAIAPVVIATIPENTAHLFQMSLYIDRLAEEKSRPPLRIKDLIGLNLVLDGIADCVNGMLGGCGGTSYSENMALMVLTRNYSVPVIIAAGIIAMLLGFFEKLAALVNTIPTAVSGGLAIYLFGVIALQGIALMISENVDLFDPRNLAIGALILVVGIGGATLPNSNIPVLGLQLPAIVTAAGLGILLNILLAPQRARNTDSQS